MAEYVTPLMQQFAAIKAEYADCLILFRLGDFYELFAEDAIVGADLLGVTLTRKAQSKGGDVPMAGVPFHALETYLPKLVSAGHKVALVEQLEPADGRTLVAREVVRIITPGTVTSDTVLQSREHRYYASLAVHLETTPTLAFADLSTGDITFTQYQQSNEENLFTDTTFLAWLKRELERFLPAELVLPRALASQPELLAISDHLGFMVTGFAGWEDWTAAPETRLQEHLSVRTLEAFGLEDNPSAQAAVSALLGYAHYTQRQSVPHLRQIRPYQANTGLQLDSATQRNLELFQSLRHQDRRGTLLKHLDQTNTALGGRTLQEWLQTPQSSLEEIQARLDSVAELLAHPSHHTTVQSHLKKIGDVERVTTRIVLRGGTPRDLLKLGLSIQAAAALEQTLQSCQAHVLRLLTPKLLQPLLGLSERIISTIDPDAPNDPSHGGVILSGVDPELDRWRGILETQHDWMLQYEQQLRTSTGISTLKVRSNKVFGFYIEVSRGARGKVPDTLERKQTLVNAERYSTTELKEQEQTLVEARDSVHSKEVALLEQLREAVQTQLADLQALAKHIGMIDALSAFAKVSHQFGYARPQLGLGNKLQILQGRHPVVEALLPSGEFIPNDTILDPHKKAIQLLTGPNMGGKSVFLRQTALIVLLAHIGCFVPATSAEIPLTDHIFVRSGAADNIADGLSTFMVEMVETASILRQSTSRSLILMDEVGRGTSTYDGLSLAWAILESLATKPEGTPKTIFATHYLELQEIPTLFANVENIQVAVHQEAEKIIFLHQVIPGGAEHSFGVSVAQMAGVPNQIIERARHLLTEFEGKQNQARKERASQHVIAELNNLSLSTMTPAQTFAVLEAWQESLKEPTQTETPESET